MTEFFTVRKEIEFDAAHRVPNHKSKCYNLHGHRYKIRVTVEGPLVDTEGTSDEGMVIDFSDIKKVLTEKIHDVYDHGTIVYEGDEMLRGLLFDGVDKTVYQWNTHLVDFIPTAENLSFKFYNILSDELDDPEKLVKVKKVEVFETPTSVATYEV